jgi:predicted metal-dependent phosphoesterase TrpH
VEVTTLWESAEYHVLLFGGQLSPPAPALGALLNGIHTRQLQLARDLVDRLARRGLALPSLDEVRRGRELMPIYVMGAVIRDGLAPNYAACLDLVRSLESTVQPAAPLPEVVAAARNSGAVAVIAHPGRNENGFAPLSHAALDRMRQAGPVDGIEVYHPNHPPPMRDYYLHYAQQRGLLVSAGSDSHGPAHARVPSPHPARLCWALLERCLPPGTALQVSTDVASAQRAGPQPPSNHSATVRSAPPEPCVTSRLPDLRLPTVHDCR